MMFKTPGCTPDYSIVSLFSSCISRSKFDHDTKKFFVPELSNPLQQKGNASHRAGIFVYRRSFAQLFCRGAGTKKAIAAKVSEKQFPF